MTSASGTTGTNTEEQRWTMRRKWVTGVLIFLPPSENEQVRICHLPARGSIVLGFLHVAWNILSRGRCLTDRVEPPLSSQSWIFPLRGVFWATPFLFHISLVLLSGVKDDPDEDKGRFINYVTQKLGFFRVPTYRVTVRNATPTLPYPLVT